MGFYDTEDGVKQYFALAEGYDGREIIDILKEHLQSGSSVLELGMGPGIDLDILKNDFDATGSDFSTIFLETYRSKYHTAKLLQLNAITLETDLHFDCIYSNKVLHHITKAELERSLTRQTEILNDKGLICHSFWKGTEEEEHEGLRFVKYLENDLEELLKPNYDVVHMQSYKEMSPDDSILVIAIKR